ncbi:hypothetical protein CSUI_006126 [Cystoisospora suis]|uniref:Uncharacterized protein n=1 Tax=Cystoisospora suis TaxID=483139 RepID=A0A2C6KVI1_9APIC|nr:hypothetical protein CSUI_006126 [Cystoisospora suis]
MSKYSQKFDVAVIANLTTTPLLRQCGLLDPDDSSAKSNRATPPPPQSEEKQSSADNSTCDKEGDTQSSRAECFLDGCLKPDALVCVETFK